MSILMILAPVLAGQPLLPAGKGGLILIAGGLVMVTVALFWLSVTPRSAMLVSHASVYHAPGGPKRRNGTRGTVQLDDRAAHALAHVGEGPRPWAAFIQDAARGSGYGSARVEASTPLACRIRIDHDDAHVLCRDEERCLRRAAHRIARGAKVREVSCGAHCVFEVRLRRR